MRPSFFRAAGALLVALMVAPIFYHLATGSDAYLTVLTDDFYYYLLVAKNLVAGGGMTFDGVTTTNGFHPLYMGLLVPLVRLCGGVNGAFFAVLALLLAGLGYAVIELLLRLGRRLFPDSPWVGPVALLCSLETTRMVVWGMETSITVPLYLLVLHLTAGLDELDARRAAWLGFLCSLLVLSRLDTALFVAMLVPVLAAGVRPRRRLLPVAAAFAGAGGLVAVYAAANVLAFGHLLPVSAQAKHLKPVLAFRTGLLPDLLDDGARAAALFAVPLAALLLAAAGRRLLARPRHVAVVAITFAFPVVYYLILALRSDWILHDWYNYPIAPALFLALLLVAEAVRRRLPAFLPRAAAVLVAAGVLAVAARTTYRRTIGFTPDRHSIYDVGRQLAARLGRHGLRYAMGDRGGLTAYLLGEPVVQIEGLIADQAMVDHIRRRDPLDRVLREYGVDRLIVSQRRPLERDGDCAIVTAPSPVQAGWLSPKMTGRFCGPPVLELTTQAPGEAPIHTYVFDARAGVNGP